MESLVHEAGFDLIYMGGIERGEQNLMIISLLRICHCLRISASEFLQQARL